MTNRRAQLYPTVANVNDIPQAVYNDIISTYEYMLEHNFTSEYEVDEEQFLVSIYNSKYAGKENQ